MKYRKWDLQLLADGGDAGNGESAGTETGVAPTGAADDAGLPKRLADLGVPQEHIEKRKKALERRSSSMRRTEAAAARPETPKTAEAAPQPETRGEQPEAAPQEAQPASAESAPSVTRESMLADPAMKTIMDEYANEIVRNRVKASGQEAEAYRAMMPLIATLAGYYGIDMQNLNIADLVNRVVQDDNYYMDRAAAENRDAAEVREESVRAMRENQQREMMLRQNWLRRRQEGEELAKKMPGFNFDQEMRNPVFSRMVGPGMPLSLEDAYFAVHRQEILAERESETRKAAMEEASRSIQAGQNRPVENGSTPTAAPAAAGSPKDRVFRENLKRRIYEAGARGEKIYPGQ